MKNETIKTPQILTSLETEVLDRFGVLPNFFRLTPENPVITENLWGFARFGYLDNPLPSLFKERLFVYLSRFCDVRYCIARHAAFLNGLGRPSGDKHCQIQSVDEIVKLIKAPLPPEQKLTEQISLLVNAEELDDMPEPDSNLEYSIFACASHVFLQTTSASLCLDALQRVMGTSKMQYLNLFLSFVRAAHYWTKLHPELRFEDDINNLLKTHRELAACILNEPEAYASQISEKMLDELLLLRHQPKKYEGLLKMVGTARDITAQRNAQLELEQQIVERTKDLERTNEKLTLIIEELANSNDNLKRSNEDLAQYAYVASHDLQEPLRKIQTFSDILVKKGDLSPDDTKYLNKIHSAAQRMSDLIKNLLQYSNILHSDLKNIDIDLSQVIKNVTKDFELVIDEKRAVIEIGELPVIEGTEVQINQLFYNLISNALKFSQEGIAPRITVASRPIGHDELKKLAGDIPDINFVDITITDNGIGFEIQYMNQIFEIFRRLHGRDVYPGSGIGLALCKRIVSNHKGYIHVESEVGKGSVFHIILPKRSE